NELHTVAPSPLLAASSCNFSLNNLLTDFRLTSKNHLREFSDAASIPAWARESYDYQIQILHSCWASFIRRCLRSCGRFAVRRSCQFRPDKPIPVYRVQDEHHAEPRPLSNHSLRWPRRSRWLYRLQRRTGGKDER